MALREYKCKCGHSFDLLFPGEYPKTMKCEKCGGTAENKFGTFGFALTFRYGWDPGAGQYFDSKRPRDNFLAEHNLEPAPDGAFETEYKGK